MSLPLAGIRVVELAGLAPVPLAGVMLGDLGADVVRVDRSLAPTGDTLGVGKRSIVLDIRSADGAAALRRLLATADVLLDPFRPGVLEHLGFTVESLPPSLIITRISGFGQRASPLRRRAGHDINYVARSGVLSALVGRADKLPTPPVNLLGDFAGGSALAVVGTLAALLARTRSGVGQVVDASMTDGATYLAAFLFTNRAAVFAGPPGTNLLDGGAPFYRCYRCADGRYMSVGALEPQFYAAFLQGLGECCACAPR